MPIAANQSLPQHEPEQIARPSTQRQAHTKFMPSKGNKIGEQTVDTNHPERKRHSGKKGQAPVF